MTGSRQHDPGRLGNRVIAFLRDGRLEIGVVTRAGASKLQVQTAAGRAVRVQPQQIVCVFDQKTSKDRVAESARFLEDRIAEAAEQIDRELLWHAAPVAEDLDPRALAAEYFGASDPVNKAAVVRALLDDTVHFERRGTAFRARSAETVEALEERARRVAERDAAEQQAAAVLETILLKGLEEVSAEDLADVEPVLVRLEDYVLRGTGGDVERILRRISIGAKRPRSCAVDILEQLGRLPPDVDRWLLRRGAFPRFPRAVEEHAAALAPWDPGTDPDRLDLTGCFGITIDDAETREIDDALSVERVGAGWRLGVHIADPAVWVQAGDLIDRIAAQRPLSLYLPTGSLPMLPERIGSDLASLGEGQDRPAISCLIDLTEDFEVAEFRFAASRIRVSRRLTYEEADALLQEGAAAGDETGAVLGVLHRLTEELRARREQNGAVRIVRPEVRIRVRGDDVRLELIDADSPAHLVVAECMILSNTLAARFALRHDIPVIFRTQPALDVADRIMTRYDPVTFLRLVRGMQKTRLSTHPGPHGGLGVDLYTQMTSPIRRYSDLVLQRQFAARFRGRQFPYDATRLIEVLGRAETQERENRRLEQDARRYWTLVWLERQKEQSHPAVVVSTGRGQEVELQDCLARARLADGGAVEIGDHLVIEVVDVRPADDVLVVRRITA